MEYGSLANPSNATFTLQEEDHTIANALRFVLNQDPRVSLAAYSIPHPSLESVNIRVQTTGSITTSKLDGYVICAREVLKDACQELMLMNRHVRSVFYKAVAEFKAEQARKKAEVNKQSDQIDSMEIETN